MAQYLRTTEGKEPNWDLSELAELYREVSRVNLTFVKRLKEIVMQDASLNAIVELDCFAYAMQLSTDEDALSELKSLFKPHLD